jgi:hypothetical protein
MASPPSLEDARLKVEWARGHIERLQVIEARFAQSHPYELLKEGPTDSGGYVYVVGSVESAPTAASLALGDICHNLRCALNYIACALVARNGSADWENTAFPIAGNAAGFDSAINNAHFRTAGADAIDLVRSLQAYQRGTGWSLAYLNQLNNIDKHRLLITLTSELQRIASPVADPVRPQEILVVESVPEPIELVPGILLPVDIYDSMEPALGIVLSIPKLAGMPNTPAVSAAAWCAKGVDEAILKSEKLL